MSSDSDHKALGAALCQKLGIDEDTQHGEIREAFLAHIQNLANSAKSLEGIEEPAAQIEDICGDYFSYNTALVKNMTAGLGDSSKDHEQAKKLKIEAGAITKALQKSIMAFAKTELSLYSVITMLEAEITEALENADESHKNIEWSYELPHQVAVACKRRDVFSEYLVRMRKAKAIVEKLDPAFVLLDRNLKEILGEKKAKIFLDDLIGNLRKLRFTAANENVAKKRAKESKGFFKTRKKTLQKQWDTIEEIAGLIIKLVEKVADHLKGREDVIFLRSWELKLAYEDMDRQLTAAREFVAKYSLPEIRFRREALGREKTRLYEIETFEGLLELLEKMQKGCNFTMATLKDVKAFEAECFNKVREVIDVKAEKFEQSRTKIEELSLPPDPESIPDSELFKENTEDAIPKRAAS